MGLKKKIRWKVIYRYLCRSARDPESLSRGVSLGLFIGFLPSVGFQIMLAILLASVLNANRLVAVLGTLVSNPLTNVPLGVFSIWIGDLILPGNVIGAVMASDFDWTSIFNSSGNLALAYIIGCLVLSTFGGFFGYIGVKFYFARRGLVRSKVYLQKI